MTLIYFLIHIFVCFSLALIAFTPIVFTFKYLSRNYAKQATTRTLTSFARVKALKKASDITFTVNIDACRQHLLEVKRDNQLIRAALKSAKQDL